MMIPSKIKIHTSASLITTTTTTTIATISILILLLLKKKHSKKNHHHLTKTTNKESSYEGYIGNTPLLHLKKLSSILSKVDFNEHDGRRRRRGKSKSKNIYVKMECFNPGGTGKDRAALFMLRDAEARGVLPPPQHNCDGDGDGDGNGDSPTGKTVTATTTTTNISDTIEIAISRSRTGGIVIEGTSGSTGISLATLSAQRGHSVIIVMPDDQAQEKQTILKCLGAILHVVPTAAISNPNHYVNVARKIADEIRSREKKRNDSDGDGDHDGRRKIIKAAFMNQFENKANYNAHYSTTGPEIFHQMGGKIDAFCMSSGTGGTISGVGQYLKDNTPNNEKCKIILIDPPGSSLYNKIKYNIAYATEQSERALRRHRYDTIAEGIGLDRITRNFALGVDNNVIDDAIRVTDQDAVDIAHWLLKEEGLFVGSSSAMNVVGAIRFAVGGGESESEHENGSSSCMQVVTVICDGGQRHLTRFWNREFIIEWGLLWPGDDERAWKNRVDLLMQ